MRVNGRPQSACTQPIAPGMIVENDTEELQALRRNLIDMLFVEGNHFCMLCEKSGNCELQALAYRLGITAPSYPFMFPKRELDASHPEIFVDRNRCILCARCVRASRELDEKEVFGFFGRGPDKRIAVNADNSGDRTTVGLHVRRRVVRLAGNDVVVIIIEATDPGVVPEYGHHPGFLRLQ